MTGSTTVPTVMVRSSSSKFWIFDVRSVPSGPLGGVSGVAMGCGGSAGELQAVGPTHSPWNRIAGAVRSFIWCFHLPGFARFCRVPPMMQMGRRA
jgi:hypothetical protein